MRIKRNLTNEKTPNRFKLKITLGRILATQDKRFDERVAEEKLGFSKEQTDK